MRQNLGEVGNGWDSDVESSRFGQVGQVGWSLDEMGSHERREESANDVEGWMCFIHVPLLFQ